MQSGKVKTGDTNASSEVKIVVMDDNHMLSLINEGITEEVDKQPSLKLVGHTCNGENPLDVCRSANPDVAIVDLINPKFGGIQTIAEIREEFPDVQVIVVTNKIDHALLVEALHAGAVAYLLKDDLTVDEIFAAVRSAHAGNSTLAFELAELLVDNEKTSEAVEELLTPREREVLGLMVQGCTNDEIARQLTISPATAKNHVSNILTKLNVTNRVEAVTVALQQRLVSYRSNNS